MKNELIGKYGTETKLCEIADSEFTAGTVMSEAIKAAGYDESASVVIGQNNWWSLTVGQLCENL